MARSSKHPSATPVELRQVMQDFKLTQAALASLVYVSERQVRNWLSGESPVPMWAVELARLKMMVRGV